MAIIIARTDNEFNLQLKNFTNKIGTYSASLGVTAAEVLSIKADSLAFDYILTNQVSTQTFAQTYTSYKNLLRGGKRKILGAVPVQTVFAAPPPMPGADIETRFRALIQRIIHNQGYTTAIGEDLGIEAPVSKFNPAAGKPEFYVEFIAGGYPNLRWVKGKFHGVEIWKDSGSGFVKLDRDVNPDYVDRSPLPAAGVTALWRYKMIYIINDEVVGKWSNEVSVTVHGAV